MHRAMNAVRKRLRQCIYFIFALLLSSLLATLSLPSFANEATPHWEYEGDASPEHWGELSPEFEQCSLGLHQSPIDLTQDYLVEGSPLEIIYHYGDAPLSVRNNGHTVQVDYPPGNFISLNGAEYQLLQFHFHTPSEHHVDGAAAAMELHLVHQDAAGQLAVLGVLIHEGDEHSTIRHIWNHIPSVGETYTDQSITLNAMDLIPEPSYYLSYTGSLTTPPCSESVSWFVLTTPLYLSSAQISTFQQYFSHNARPTQPMNDRLLEFHTGADI